VVQSIGMGLRTIVGCSSSVSSLGTRDNKSVVSFQQLALGPAVHVIPQHEFEARPRLFDALGRALGLTFTADLTRQVVATLVLGETGSPVSRDVPTLRLARPEPALGSPALVRLSDSARLDPALRRQVLSDGFVGATPGLSPSPSAEILASRADQVLWTHDGSTEQAAVIPHELAPGDTLRNRMRPGAVLPLLPLTSFLLRVAEASGLMRPALRATFLIDDPNLHRPRYGYLDFAELDERARAEGWHIAFATIPMDGWFVDKRAVELFKKPASHLSLLIHGNRHVKHELARLTNDDRALREMSQALRRIRRLEKRTGLRVSRVMAPPHGVYSPTVARALARLELRALCISNAYPWVQPDAARQPLAGWRPADFVEGLPIIPRHHIAGDSEELVLRAFLRQPLVIYGHHTDAAHGLDVFSDAANRIDSLGAVSWMDLDGIARTNAEIIATRERTLIRPYGNQATIDLDRPTTVVVEIDDDVPVDVELTTGRDVYLGQGPHTIESTGQLRIVSRRRDRVDASEIPPPHRSPWPLTRRLLTESRDRLTPILRR
jgi:hypothetical protein